MWSEKFGKWIHNMKETVDSAQKSELHPEPRSDQGVTCVPLDNQYLFRINQKNLTSYDCEFAKNLKAEDIKVDYQNGVLKLRIPRAVDNEGEDFTGAPSRHVWNPTESPFPKAS